MAELKTKQSEASVEDFIHSLEDEAKRKDSFRILDIMKEASGDAPKMWGPSIVGFGSRVLKYDSGRVLDWFTIGFSPRKKDFSLYLAGGLESFTDQLKRLGKHKTGKGCLYVHQLADVDLDVLKEILQVSMQNNA